MQELVAELGRMPLYAQLFIALAAAYFIYGLLAPTLRDRRCRQRFTALAERFGQRIASSKDGPATFPVTVDQRVFRISHEYRGSSAQSSATTYRGPRGHVLVVSTPLAGETWHLVDIARLNKIVHAVSGATRTTTGDAAFDADFRVLEDGLPVRERWLNAQMRAAVRQLFETLPPQTVVAIQEGTLVSTMMTPWPEADALRAAVTQHAAFAAVLETITRRSI
jgi:hypothetical protein